MERKCPKCGGHLKGDHNVIRNRMTGLKTECKLWSCTKCIKVYTNKELYEKDNVKKIFDNMLGNPIEKLNKLIK